jgi:quercetin dioxygenase-like cupin family protein
MSAETHRSEAIARNDHMVSIDYDAIKAFPEDHVLQLLVGKWTDQGPLDGVTIVYNGKQPGFATESETGFHSHPYDQIFYLFSGSLMVQIEGEEEFKMHPGDVLTYPAGLVHRNWVEGPEKTFLLGINIPK